MTRSLLEAAKSLLILTVIALFFVTFTIQPFRIPSASMEPTLLVGDLLLADKQTAPSPLLPPISLHHGDIVIFHDPLDPTRQLIKRIVALPGDRIRLRDGVLYRNGEPVSEPYAVRRPSPPDPFRDYFPNTTYHTSDIDPRWWNLFHALVRHGELPIPPGSVFVLGDNRDDSLDSRYWGFVPIDAIVGRPFLIYLSLRLPDTDPQGEPQPRQPLPFPQSLARWQRTLTLVR